MSRRVVTNVIWNVAGTLISAVVGLVVLPVMLQALGAARLGIFTLALGLIGFSGLLDLGLGRALTQSVSSAIGRGRPREAITLLVWHVLRLLAGFGVLWLVLLWFLVPVLVEHLFSLKGKLAAETIFGLRAVALSMPFALVATGAMGSLEGLQQFRHVSTWRFILSVFQYGLPTLIVLWHPDVGLAMAALAVSRVLSMCVWLRMLAKTMPGAGWSRSHPDDLHHLLNFGGWLSISNLIGPLMVYADRFYLASLFPPAAVAYYTVPYDTLLRVTSIPATAIGAVFPALAGASSGSNESAKLVRLTTVALIAFMLPPLLLVTIFSKLLLTFWLGKVFALSALPIFKVLVIGIFINSTAQVPYALLQANGRSDLTAKLHLMELPAFVGLLVWAVSVWGLVGAAVAWTLRVALDACALYVWAIKLQPSCSKVLVEALGLVLFSCCMLLMPSLSDNRLLLIFSVVIVFILSSIMLWGLRAHWLHAKYQVFPHVD